MGIPRLKTIVPAVLLITVLPVGQGLVHAQSPISTEDLDIFSWRHVGPWTFSGRITAFAVPPGQSLTYYALTGSGGLWKTEDGGISFKSIFDHYGTLSMGHLGIAPSDPDILYLGTGEAMHARSSAHGNGVWKSTDAGETWQPCPGLEESHYIPKVVAHPTNPDIVYVACEGKLYDNEMDSQRGLYMTTDGGQTWENVWPVDDRGVGDFVMDPNNPDVIIAAAYKTFRRTWTFIDRQEGNWLYKTTDGGRTWRRLENGLPLDIPMGRAGLAMYPKNPNIVYTRLDEEVNIGLTQSWNQARFNARALFRDDFYFNNWKDYQINRQIARTVRHDKIEAESASDVVEKLNELVDDREFLSKARVNLERFNQRAREVFADDEDIIASIDEIEKLLATPEEETGEGERNAGRHQTINRYVLQTIYGGALAIMQPVRRDGVVYRSDDQGETWTRMTEYAHQGGSRVDVNTTEAGYYGRMEVDPNNDQILYLCQTTVAKSEDGGQTFSNTRWTGKNRCHVDTRGMWIDPLNSNHILNGNDGGVSETWDGGEHWSQKDRIAAQQFYDISVDDEFPYNVMGGTQDNGAWFGPSRNRNSYGVYPADWTYLPTGDAYYVLHDWWNPEYIYFESQFGGSSRMDFRTGERTRIQQRTPAEEAAAGRPAERYQWDAPIFLSPHNPGIVFICSQHVWRSQSRGDEGTFERVSPDLSRADPERIAQSKLTNLQYATIYTFAESAVQPGVYWAGTDDGNLQVSTDFGKNWTNITFEFWNEDGTPKSGVRGDRIPFDRWVARVAPSSHALERCYVAWTGYRTHNEDTTYIFVTEDMGRTWKNLSNGMENPVNDIVEDPDNPDVLYLATDYGLFLSCDRGDDWIKMQGTVGTGSERGPAPDAIIMDIDIQKRERDLAIGTYGRGIYLADIWPCKEFSAEVFAKDAHLFEPQRTIRWEMVEQRGPTYGEFAWVPNPPSVTNIYYYLKEDSESVQIVITDLAGDEMTAIQGQGELKEKGLHHRTWNMRQRMQRTAGGGQARGGQARPGQARGGPVPAGVYKVTLVVDGEEVMTHDLRIVADPILNPDKP